MVVADVVATEEPVICDVGVKRRLEVVLKVSPGYAPEYLAVLGGETRVACPAAPAALCDQLLTDAHGYILPERDGIRSRVRVGEDSSADTFS